MDDKQQVKVRFTPEEADIIAKAVGKQPGESLALAIKKFFNTRDHSKRVQSHENRPQPKY